MDEQAKIVRVIELILNLSEESGYTKESLKKKLDISDSTFKRYIKTLKDVGFDIKVEKKYYKIENDGSLLNSIISASILTEKQKELITNSSKIEGLEESEKQKLYSDLSLAFESDPIIYTFVKYEQLKIIQTLRKAIIHNKQILIQNYSSSNTSTVKDRLVEPFKFGNSFKYIWCYEIETGICKQFKISRMEDIELLEQNCEYNSKHKALSVDIFGMSAQKTIMVKVELSMKARNLIIEEFQVNPNELKSTQTNSFELSTKICSIDGIGRFIRGLPNETKLISPKTLEEIENKLERINVTNQVNTNKNYWK
jgi:predicted DNA-binding transcriptional regulator YafY